MIQINNLNKKFGKLKVLVGLDLSIGAGGIFAILGPNGSGKTTLGKQLAKKMHYSFFDSDQEIEKQEGCSIKELCKKDGELVFREKEYLFLKI